jgi:NADH:ubiquinone oxidoreductase subunit E
MSQRCHGSLEPSRCDDALLTAAVERILEQHRGQHGALIAVLGAIQAEQGYLSEQALRRVSSCMGLSLVDVYGVATFYRGFSLTPRGRHLLCVCQGTACHVRGAPRVVEELERQLEIKNGQTTADGEFSLETANCLGACALGPIVVIDDKYFSNVGTAKAKRILKRVRSESVWPAETPPEAADEREQRADGQAEVA